MKLVQWICAAIVAAVLPVPSMAGIVLVSADLQRSDLTGQATQPGWQEAGISRDGTSGPQTLPLSAAGSAAGITATLVTPDLWYARATPDFPDYRAFVQGTSFDGVVSDLWFTRSLVFSLDFTGLTAGESYVLRAWHNDSYMVNEGAAAGGGTVHPSISGGTVTSSVDGTVTNLGGTRTDTDFGITQLTFQPSSSTATITFARSTGGFEGVPLNGIELTVNSVPEIDPAGLGSVVALLTSALGLLEKRRMKTG